MKKRFLWMKEESARCAVRIAACFGLTSAVYLSWVYRLLQLGAGSKTEWISIVAGYLFQAGGLAITGWYCALHHAEENRRADRFLLLLFALVTVPLLLGRSLTGAVLSGFGMNLICGGIAGFYLMSAAALKKTRRSLVFGGAYAAATAVVGLLALPGEGTFLQSGGILFLYLSLTAAILMGISFLAEPAFSVEKADRPGPDLETLVLACAVVLLTSLVKSLGFAFPSADIAAGLKPELTRLPYAAGLLAAGWIFDSDRRRGLLFTLMALVIPFIMLDVASEPVPGMLFWGLDYLFFGFFSVFRAVLFLDLAAESGRQWLSPFGLLFGRLGDAAGTGISILLENRGLWLTGITALFFFLAVVLLIRLAGQLYETPKQPERSEQEVFEEFCMQRDISSREKEVLGLMLAGRSNREIAETLFIVEGTVKFHMRNLLHKTGCRSRQELRKKYMEVLYPGLEGRGGGNTGSQTAARKQTGKG